MNKDESKNNIFHPTVIITFIILIFVSGYLFFDKKQNNSSNDTAKENKLSTSTPVNSEVEQLRQELENLKKTSKNKSSNEYSENHHLGISGDYLC